MRNLLFVSLCAVIAMASVGCTATIYHPLTGQKIFEGEIKDNPSKEEAKDEFDKLEKALKENLAVMKQARAERNELAMNMCLDNMNKGAERKEHLSNIIG